MGVEKGGFAEINNSKKKEKREKGDEFLRVTWTEKGKRRMLET